VILVKRYLLIVGFVFAAAAILGIGLLGYFSFAGTPGSASAAFRGENLVFAAVTAVIVLTTLVWRLFLGSRRVDREMDRLIESSRYGGFSIEHRAKTLGSFGVRLATLHRELTNLNQKKSEKMSAMHALIELLCDNLETPVVVLDAVGSVVYAGKSYLEHANVPQTEVERHPISDLVEDLRWAEISAELRRTHAAVERSLSGNDLRFYPVRDVQNEISYVVVTFLGRLVISREKIHRAADEQARRFGGAFQRLFGPRKNVR
jgi:PAS domain-containing protein